MQRVAGWSRWAFLASRQLRSPPLTLFKIICHKLDPVELKNAIRRVKIHEVARVTIVAIFHVTRPCQARQMRAVQRTTHVLCRAHRRLTPPRGALVGGIRELCRRSIDFQHSTLILHSTRMHRLLRTLGINSLAFRIFVARSEKKFILTETSWIFRRSRLHMTLRNQQSERQTIPRRFPERTSESMMTTTTQSVLVHGFPEAS